MKLEQPFEQQVSEQYCLNCKVWIIPYYSRLRELKTCPYCGLEVEDDDY